MQPKILQPVEGWTVEYPQVLELAEKAMEVFWMAREIQVEADVNKFLIQATDAQRHAINTIAQVFVAQELSVANYWIERIYKDFPRPEFRAMSTYFGMTEQAIHARFYAKLPEALGLDADPDFYDKYLTIPEFRERMVIVGEALNSGDLFLSIATFAIIEKVTLFTQFAVIKSFNVAPYNIFPKVADGINFSSVDENCVTPETEVLTPTGFKRIDLLQDTDTIAQWGKDGIISYVVPQKVIRKQHNGQIIRFESKSNKIPFSQHVTPNHRVVRRYSCNAMGETEYDFVTADKFKPNASVKLPVSGFLVGSVNQLTCHDQFKIAAQADGHVSDRYDGSIAGTRPIQFFFSKERKIERFTSILRQCGYAYSQVNKKAVGNKKEGITFTVNVPMADWINFKSLAWVDLSDKSSTWCQHFIDEVVEWDGHKNKHSINNSSIIYDSVVLSNSERVQLVATMCGYRTNLTHKEDGRSETYSTIHRVFMSKETEKRMGATTKTYEDYSGMVYCVTVPTGAFVIRHNDNVSVTGNCHGEGGILLFNLLRKEVTFNENTYDDIVTVAKALLEHEYHLLDLIYEKGSIDTVTKEDLKLFLHHRWNDSMTGLGFANEAVLPIGDNPVAKWFYKGIHNKMTSTDNFAALSNTYNRKWLATNFTWESAHD